jgi:hypothetical protein
VHTIRVRPMHRLRVHLIPVHDHKEVLVVWRYISLGYNIFIAMTECKDTHHQISLFQDFVNC